LEVLSLSKDGDLDPFDYWGARLLRRVYPELAEGPSMTAKRVFQQACQPVTVLRSKPLAFSLSFLHA
jgi:hypothetical protein